MLSRLNRQEVAQHVQDEVLFLAEPSDCDFLEMINAKALDANRIRTYFGARDHFRLVFWFASRDFHGVKTPDIKGK